MPEISRQTSSPKASFCRATMTLAAVYQSSEAAKIVLRPNLSARKPHRIVPMNRPVNKAAMNPATPVVPNNPGVVGVSRPDLTSEGAI